MPFQFVLTYPASGGYLLEQIIISIPSLIALSMTISQFCVWSMPESRQRVKKLQMMSQIPVFLQNVLVLIVDLDIRCALGIYSPAALLALTALTAQFPAISLILWLQELSKILMKSEEVGLMSFRISMTFLQEPSVVSSGCVSFAITAFFVTCLVSVLACIWQDRIIYSSVGVLAMAVVTLFGFYFTMRFLKVIQGYSQNHDASGKVHQQKEVAKGHSNRLKTKMWKAACLAFVLFSLLIGFSVHIIMDLHDNNLQDALRTPDSETYTPNVLVWTMILLNFLTSVLFSSVGWMPLDPLGCCIGCLCCRPVHDNHLPNEDPRSEPLLLRMPTPAAEVVFRSSKAEALKLSELSKKPAMEEEAGGPAVMNEPDLT
eukprot:TRINITY_DN1172_c0_g1_i1.p1 TRINITY_DN1172_c0_g1~~TRINITY_DN1172_c0_g1_i1.p1  ORF type:complete len:373 (+),score=82.75 TRINITY_DN1172_c0_g1_i1:69-1187(+)